MAENAIGQLVRVLLTHPRSWVSHYCRGRPTMKILPRRFASPMSISRELARWTCSKCHTMLPEGRVCRLCTRCQRASNRAWVPTDRLGAKAAGFMYAAGMTLAEVGEWCGASSSMMTVWKRWADWPKPDPHMIRTLDRLRKWDVPGLHRSWVSGEGAGKRILEAAKIFGWCRKARMDGRRGRGMVSRVCLNCERRLPIESFEAYRDERHPGGGGIRTVCVECRHATYLKHRALRRSRLKNADDGSITSTFLRQLGGKVKHCVYCLETLTDANRSLEHIRPLSRGGKHTAKNVTFCCRSCNSSKRDRHARTMATHEQGVLDV